MRLRRYATILASACSLHTSIAVAASIGNSAGKKQDKSALEFEEQLRRRTWKIPTQGEPIVQRYPDPAEGPDLEKNKYFHEPGGDDILGHYDLRFFKGVVTHRERTDTLHHMIRAYLNFFQEHGLETWIAHGTLLGWWWNGKILPWDWDIDTQVSGETLDYMAKNLNQTKVPYQSGSIRRKYLLDVNPWVWERDRGDGMNIIDARWVDVRNGLYIDITALSETQPDVAPGIWSCKNYHHYRTRDLYPMRESTFEGVPAKIPYAYDRLLMQEYHQKAFVLTEYEGHYWDEDTKEWTPKPEKTDHEPEPVSRKRRRLFGFPLDTA